IDHKTPPWRGRPGSGEEAPSTSRGAKTSGGCPENRAPAVRPSEEGHDPRGSAAQHAPQDVLHDPAVAVVVGLAGGVDADHGVELDLLAAVLGGGDVHGPRGGAVVERGDAG